MKNQHDHHYSRREFGKLALAGVPAALVLARAGLSAADSKINGVRIGAQSYSFREMSLDEAINAYKASVEANEKNEFAWINLGIALKTVGKAAEAKQAGQKAKSINPNNPEISKLMEGL